MWQTNTAEILNIWWNCARVILIYSLKSYEHVVVRKLQGEKFNRNSWNWDWTKNTSRFAFVRVVFEKLILSFSKFQVESFAVWERHQCRWFQDRSYWSNSFSQSTCDAVPPLYFDRSHCRRRSIYTHLESIPYKEYHSAHFYLEFQTA